MANKGCWSMFFVAAAILAVTYGVLRGIYAVFLPSTTEPLSLFHEHILSFHDYYTAGSRKRLETKRSEPLWGTGAFYVLVVLLLYSVGRCSFRSQASRGV